MYQEYERRKREWVKAHPDSTPEEYERAIKKILKELKL